MNKYMNTKSITFLSILHAVRVDWKSTCDDFSHQICCLSLYDRNCFGPKLDCARCHGARYEV